MVEDDPDLLELIAFNLKCEGYEVVTARDGIEALEEVHREKPDLIVLDIMMPRVDGWEVLSRLRKAPDTVNLPVIILTVKKEDVSVLFGFELGANDYLTKPFRIEELSARVKAILRMYEQTKKVEGKEALEKIPVLFGERGQNLLDQEEIIYVNLMRNYSYVHTFERKHIARFSLGEMEKKLSDDFFMRVHRGYIINLRQVKAVFSPTRLKYKVQLKDKNETVLPVSRDKVKQLRDRLGM
ncbi:MAG: response regulator transcription factor [Actinobacteria bacterium]|nr:response regulator transcription factor [Actinomycetota bacterium]